MNVLFIFSVRDYYTTSKPLHSYDEMQFGISYISAVLKRSGHNTKLLVLTRETKKDVIDKYINNFNPKLICFTSVCTEYKFISKVSKYIKNKFPSIYQLIGGPHVSLKPDQAINESFDAVCIGEGEFPTLKLVEKLEKKENPSKISNLWIKSNGLIEKNPTKEFLADLNSLPFSDKEIWREWVSGSDGKRQVILLARGCPFICTYCINHALKKIAPGKYVRFRSPESIVDELEDTVNKFPNLKEIYFEVETIGVDSDFAEELCSRLKAFNKKYGGITYGVNLRIMPNLNYNKLFQNFKEANFRFINIGIESGSKKMRQMILKRYYSNEDIIKTIKLAKSYGFKVFTYVLLGLPDETIEDFKKTIECCRKCQPDDIWLSIFYPYPGTDLYTYCKEKGYLSTLSKSISERSQAVLNYPGFSRKQIQRQYTWFYYNVYKGYKPLYVILSYALYQKVKSNYHLSLIYRRLSKNILIRKAVDQVKLS